jgi:cytidine deaminase
VRGASGSLYLGANIEVSGQCLGFAVHAEQSALSNAYMNSEESVSSLAVVGGAPCGHCRQFMEEISPAGEILILIPNQPSAKLASMLPVAFGPAALGATQGALPVRTANLAVSGGTSDALTAAALDAACRSYAPYSKSPAGVAIRTTGGRVFQGCYIENVAFNPASPRCRQRWCN